MVKTSKNLFNNTELAFTNKSNFELKKAFFLFSVLDFPLLTKIGNSFLILVLKLKLPFKGIIKKTIFNHFCGGETIEECDNAFNSLKKYNISAMPEYSVEAESSFEGFENYKNDSVDLINYLGDLSLPFIAIKCTGLMDISSLEKISSGKLDEKSDEYKSFFKRVDDLCDVGNKNNVKVLIDAEESWIQDAIDTLGIEMMRKYNKKRANVFLTHQCYRTGTLDKVKNNLELAKKENFYLGVKLVRGAYMEKERKRAIVNNYTSPIHNSKDNTDEEFNKSLMFCVKNINKVSLWVGSHNENSCLKLMEMMKDNNISKDDQRIWFSQLYGMSDNISYTLSSLKYNVVKLIPFGPIEKTIPYLIRRANENSSVKGQSNRQFTLIKDEINRRNKLN
ncbi:MAG: proline dehydrogenase [Flammeovirgaceae bacterium]|nr:proline dehydrogenase [Flammeovirgaceae bacterium]